MKGFAATSCIDASALTTYDVEADGGRIRMHVRDSAGKPATVILPFQCANQLLMSLPAMLQTAIKRSGDDSLRLVYPLSAFKLELGERNTEGLPQLILTLETEGGFSVSFAATEESLSGLAQSILNSTDDLRQTQHVAPLRN